ncbi:uncharacterized protein LOC141826248 [Curcuma longa]|uniref:uncharacterized protein LOC141826248 n=1 Tax=Curcuma longa TaxID=136217 RepID=UPI003D9F7119
MPMATSIGLDQQIGSSVMRMSGRRRRKGVLKHSGRQRRRRLGAGRRKQRLASSSKAVAQRLEALRSLIPQRNSGAKEEEAAADRLFEETAEYILLLRTQVAVLKRLVDVYSPGISVKNDGDCA